MSTDARSAAFMISSTLLAALSSPFTCSATRVPKPTIVVRMLLNSCATPPASRPTVSIFCASWKLSFEDGVVTRVERVAHLALEQGRRHLLLPDEVCGAGGKEDWLERAVPRSAQEHERRRAGMREGAPDTLDDVPLRSSGLGVDLQDQDVVGVVLRGCGGRTSGVNDVRPLDAAAEQRFQDRGCVRIGVDDEQPDGIGAHAQPQWTTDRTVSAPTTSRNAST